MSDYQVSQDLILDAEAALADGDIDRARSLLHDAAVLQQRFMESLPSTRIRTKSAF